MEQKIIGWSHLASRQVSLRRKAIRQRVWRVLNIVVAVATIANVSSLTALAPKPVAAAAASVWTTRTTCVNPDPQDENHYVMGDTVYIRGSNFTGTTTVYWKITGKPGGASVDPNEIVASGSTTTDADGYFCLGAYVVGSDGDEDSGEYGIDVDYDTSFHGSKQDNYRVDAEVGSLTVNKVVDSGSASPDSFVFEIVPDPYGVGQFSTSGGSITFNDMPVDNYTVEEVDGPNGYHLVSNNCDIDVVEGENVSCTVHNARDMGTIHVFKQVRTAFGSWWEPQADELWSWTVSGDATEYHWGDSADVETNVVKTITEDPNDFPAPGYATEWSCYEGETFFSSGTGRSIDLTLTQDEQEVVCTFYNKELGDIHGQKWNDLNGNGTWENGEPALNGWTVFIDANSNGALDSGEQSMVTQFHDDGLVFTTDDNGWYWFENLPDGDYKVCEVSQGGWQQTFPVNGNNNCHTVVVGQSQIDREDPSTCSGQNVSNSVLAPSCNFGNHVVPVTTITLDKTGPATANPGNQITYTLAWTVAGNTAATNAVITDPIPANTTFVSQNCGTTAGTCTPTFAAGVASWALGTRNPGESGTVTMTVVVSSSLTTATTLVNTGTFDTDQTPPVSDPANTNVTIPQVLGETAEPNLTLTKSVDKTTTNPGKTLNYTLVVTNTGEGDAFNVIVTDTLPNGFTYADNGRTTRTWTYAELLAGESKTITYQVLVGDDVTVGDYVNTAFALADTLDPVSAQATVNVKVPQVLGLATTGMGLRDYILFMTGFGLLAAGFVLIQRYRRELGLVS